jgi:hypothetical protein
MTYEFYDKAKELWEKIQKGEAAEKDLVNLVYDAWTDGKDLGYDHGYENGVMNERENS